jgi:fumarate hydratase class II
VPSLERLQATLDEKARAFESIVKIGRTHLQDATPLTLGQEFSGYAAQLTIAGVISRPPCRTFPSSRLGGTAVGTGLNAHPGIRRARRGRAHAAHGLRFSSTAPNKFEALGNPRRDGARPRRAENPGRGAHEDRE